MQDLVKIRRALISVSDKTNLEVLVKTLSDYEVEILSTGGTLAAILKMGVQATAVDDYTGFPEMLDGRVKTLHPKIHGGLLGRRDNPAHLATMAQHQIEAIDLVVVNLYPFEQTIKKTGVTLEEAIENIDIGGPSMIRSASKNSDSVTVITHPRDYDELMAILKVNQGATHLEFRRKMAQRAFAQTSQYDALIADYLGQNFLPAADFPATKNLSLRFSQELRYGENPHQKAAFYRDSAADIQPWKNLQGKELSYNNLLDLDAAIKLGSEFSQPVCAIFKHTNPCGIAVGGSPLENLQRAIASDPVSYFGGIALFNEAVDLDVAKKINESFFEIVVAESFSEAAMTEFSRKKNLRVVAVKDLKKIKPVAFEMRNAAFGILLQQADSQLVTADQLEIVSQKKPSENEIQQLLFAFQCVKYVKSNAIVFTSENQTLGIGAGQMSRVDSIRLAIEKARLAGLSLKQSVLGSDAFFPFKDGIELAIQAGAKAIIQPGGSMRDQESIDAANAAGVIMAFTGLRHFRH